MEFDWHKHRIEILTHGVLTLVALIGAYLLYSAFPNDLSSSNQVVIDPTKYDGVITSVNNDVRWKSAEEIAWTDLFMDHGLKYGEQVYVGENSSSVIVSKSFRAQVLENTLFTFTQKANETAFVFERGAMEIETQEGAPVAFEVGSQKVRLKGQSKLLVQRSSQEQDKDVENIGISVLSGKAKMITPSGRVLPVSEGQAFAIVPGDKDKGPKFKSMHIKLEDAEKQKVFFPNEPISLSWDAKARKFKSIDLQVSSDSDFKKILLEKAATADSANLPPLPPGRYYWRIKGNTGSAMIYGPASKIDVVVENTPKHFAPDVYFSKPGEWKVVGKTVNNEIADAYEFEVSTDDKFKNVVSRTIGKEASATLAVKKEGELFTRVRFKYKGRDRFSNWSLSQQVETPSFVDAPALSIEKSKEDADFILRWNSLPEVSFYKVFQDSLDQTKKNSFISQGQSLKIRALTRSQSEVFVRGHKAENHFGFNSNRILVKGFVDKPTIEKIKISPRWLARFNERQNPILEFKINMGLQENEFARVEVSSKSDFSDKVEFEVRASEFKQEVPQWEEYYIRALIVLDTNIFFTNFSKVYKEQYPRIERLRAPVLKLPRNFENIVILTKKPQILFSWVPYDENVRYDIEIAKDKDFNQVVYRAVTDGKSLMLPELLPSGDYFWRMRSFNQISESNWSEIFGVVITNGN